MSEPLMIDVRRLGGVAEIADLLGVGVTVASNWHGKRERTGFPAALPVELARGALWDLQEVLVWWLAWVPRVRGKHGTVNFVAVRRHALVMPSVAP